MQASFLFGEDKLRLTGEVISKGPMSAWIKATLPDDFGGKTITLKRHVRKHQVQFLNEG